MRRVIALSLAVLLSGNVAQAANHYIRDGGSGSLTGTGDCADWSATHACDDLPATLVRGDTYFFASGSYAARVLNTAASGTSVIAFQAATVASHGTATGWLDSYVGTATFACASSCAGTNNRVIDFATSYWTLNGVYRNSDWMTGYGFKFDGQSVVASNSVLGCGDSDPHDIHDLTIQYVEVNGTHPAVDTDPGTNIKFWSCYNLSFQSIYSHDAGDVPMMILGPGSSWGSPGQHAADTVLIERSLFSRFGGENACSGCTAHTEVAIRDGVTNFTFRYNYVRNCGTTACFASPSGSNWDTGNWHNGPWYVYGNVFHFEQDDTHCGPGDGAFSGLSAAFDASAYFLNNTFANIRIGSPGCIRSGANIGAAAWNIPGNWHMQGGSTFYSYNNLFWASWNTSNQMVGIGTIAEGSLVYGYHAYYTLGTGTHAEDVSGTKIVITGAGADPFTSKYALTPGSDFTLTSSPGSGFDTSGLVSGNGTDMNGVTRTTFNPGAFEFGTGGGAAAPGRFRPIIRRPGLPGDDQ